MQKSASVLSLKFSTFALIKGQGNIPLQQLTKYNKLY